MHPQIAGMATSVAQATNGLEEVVVMMTRQNVASPTAEDLHSVALPAGPAPLKEAIRIAAARQLYTCLLRMPGYVHGMVAAAQIIHTNALLKVGWGPYAGRKGLTNVIIPQATIEVCQLLAPNPILFLISTPFSIP